MADELNKDYAPLTEYLTGIMHKLQQQSDLLRGKDVALCLTEDYDVAERAAVSTGTQTVLFNVDYLRENPSISEDAVAAEIAHELSHLVYREKFALAGKSKEEEIFADNYGLVLLNRAGYNVRNSLHEEELEVEENRDVHPADKIRELICRRTVAALNAPIRENTPFTGKIPNTPLVETAYNVLQERGQRLAAHDIRQANTDLERQPSDVAQKYDDLIPNLTALQAQTDADDFVALVGTYLSAEHRAPEATARRKLHMLYASALYGALGKDDGSAEYGQRLGNELEKLRGQIHNADALPLAQILQKRLQINDNMHILQKFVKDNSFEMNQIRSELLLTECLVYPEQALPTAQYLSGLTNEVPMHYVDDDNGERYSYISADELQNLRDDWANVTPSKRADIFAILMENVAPKDNPAQKLAQFIGKTAENDAVYKPLVEMYLATYTPEQQPYAVSTLVSRKELNRPYGYEDYFKAILLNSGIKGLRAYNAVYNIHRPEQINKLSTNSSALVSEDGIIFNKLAELGRAAQQSDNPELQKIGRQLVYATQKQSPLNTAGGNGR